jgi:hypothetical protein
MKMAQVDPPALVRLSEGLGAASEASHIAAMVRFDAMAEVGAERERQDAKWGGPEADDARKTPADWVQDIDSYVTWAGQMARMGDLNKYRRRMMQVAALALAACEHYDRRKTRAVRSAIGA